MAISTNAWLFLVGANKNLEYRTLIQPDFASDFQKPNLFRDQATGNETKENQIRCREILEHNFTILYQVKLVTNREIGVASANSDDYVRDQQGRIINLIESIALKGLKGYELKSGNLKISRDTFVGIHQEALKYYCEFWGKTEIEFSGYDISSDFCLQNNNDDSEILEVEIVGNIYQINTQKSATEVNAKTGFSGTINSDIATINQSFISLETQRIHRFYSPVCSVAFSDNKLIVRLDSQDLRVINTELDYQYKQNEWNFLEEFEIDKSGQYPDKRKVLNSQVVCSPRGDLIASAMTIRDLDNILLKLEEVVTKFLKAFIRGLDYPDREAPIIYVSNAHTGEIIKVIPILAPPTMVSLAFTSSGEYLVLGNSNKNVEIWPINMASEKPSFIPTKADITALAVSRIDNIAITDSGGGLTLYNLPNKNTWLEIRKAHKLKINSVAFSPDGKYLVTAGKGRELKIWHIENDNPIKEIESSSSGGNLVEFNTVAFSPDGQYIATGDNEKTVKLWDSHGKLIRTFEGHTESVTTVAFSPNGKLASGSRDCTIRIWEYR